MTLSMTLDYHTKKIFTKNGSENVQQKLVPGLFIILVNISKQPLH